MSAEGVEARPPAFKMSRHHPDCTCAYAWRSLGRLYDQDMGEAWVRATTEGECPHHGEEARERARAAALLRHLPHPRTTAERTEA